MEPIVTIVDDNQELRFLVSFLLKNECGIGSLKLASLADVIAHAPEVLESEVTLLDINLGMGEPDGIDVYEWLKGHQYSGKVLFLTGHAMGSPFVRRAVETGAPVFEKPMSTEDLVAILKETAFKTRRSA